MVVIKYKFPNAGIHRTNIMFTSYMEIHPNRTMNVESAIRTSYTFRTKGSVSLRKISLNSRRPIHLCWRLLYRTVFKPKEKPTIYEEHFSHSHNTVRHSQHRLSWNSSMTNVISADLLYKISPKSVTKYGNHVYVFICALLYPRAQRSARLAVFVKIICHNRQMAQSRSLHTRRSLFYFVTNGQERSRTAAIQHHCPHTDPCPHVETPKVTGPPLNLTQTELAASRLV